MFGNILEELVQILNALANEQRLTIVYRTIQEDEVPCEKLAEELPITRPALSHHVRILKQTRIIRVIKKGQYIYYKFNREYLSKVSPELVEYLEKEVSKWQK
ncbi:MAG: metalloregulator ArsR/SmtB family transcription factor [Actinobacteria bacterium]|nr:metalloregulator ArsR/SmtB family transcription factor [Actinomycetota bacterium]